MTGDLLDPAPAKKAKITAADIRLAMLNRFAAAEWAILWEVAPGTGAATNYRFADAVMMSLWPSRGLELHGVEIKVSRSDWRREAMDPKKAEAIAKFCHRWWVHVAPGVIHDLSEVPPAWGVREWDGKKWRTLREAARTDAEPVTYAFLAALLRRSSDAGRKEAKEAAEAVVREARAAIDKTVEERVAGELQRRSERYEELKGAVDAFEETTGMKLSDRWDGADRGKRLGAAVNTVMRLGLDAAYDSLTRLVGDLRQRAVDLERDLTATGFVDPESPKFQPRKLL